MKRPFFFPRQGECWIGPVGLFYNRCLVGIELPSGRYIGWSNPPQPKSR